MFDLRYYQHDACDKTREAWDQHGSTAVIMPTGTGKCLDRRTPVLMADGTIKLAGDVRVGDLLMGPDGRPRRVLSTTSGREEMYRVERSGDPGGCFVCNASHLLALQDAKTGRHHYIMAASYAYQPDTGLVGWAVDPSTGKVDRFRVNVSPVGPGEYYGWTIDGDGLFLLGDHTVTHNTELYLSLAVAEKGRVLVVVHRDYLISSPIERLSRAGFYDVAIEKAMMHSERGRIGGRAQIVFASVQSIGPVRQQYRLEKFDPKQFSLVIWDEAHRAVSSVYRRIKEYFEAKNPRLKSLYLTATPKRKDGIALGNVCTSVAYEMSPAQAVEQGWIVPPRFFVRDVPTMDFSKIDMKGQDFDQHQLDELITQEETLHEVCGSLAKDDGRMIVFCPGVTAAKVYAHVLNRYKPGKSIVLSQESSDEEREAAKTGLVDGTLQYLLNCDIVSEGYDVPAVESVGWTTPTASLVKWTQGCGRGFRPDPVTVKLLQQHAGRDQADIRRQLIAQSAKPHCSIITYHPSNRQHQICTAVDILGGKDLGDVSMFAAQVQERTSRQMGGSNTEEDIETAKVFMDFKAALESARQKIIAEVKVQDTEYDGMGTTTNKLKNTKPKASNDDALLAAQISWHCSTEKGNAPASEPQKKWFMWKGISPAIAETLTKWRAMVVRDLYENGIGLETALKWHRRQCLKVRDELKAKREGSISQATPREEPIPE